jgi:hypothetical protein
MAERITGAIQCPCGVKPIIQTRSDGDKSAMGSPWPYTSDMLEKGPFVAKILQLIEEIHRSTLFSFLTCSLLSFQAA